MYKYRVFLTNQMVINISTKTPLKELIEKILDACSMEFLETAYINTADGATSIKYNQIVAFELIEEPFDLEKEMAKILEIIDNAILRTPTGTLRNRLTDINMSLMIEKDVIGTLVEAEKENVSQG